MAIIAEISIVFIMVIIIVMVTLYSDLRAISFVIMCNNHFVQPRQQGLLKASLGARPICCQQLGLIKKLAEALDTRDMLLVLGNTVLLLNYYKKITSIITIIITIIITSN